MRVLFVFLFVCQLSYVHSLKIRAASFGLGLGDSEGSDSVQVRPPANKHLLEKEIANMREDLDMEGEAPESEEEDERLRYYNFNRLEVAKNFKDFSKQTGPDAIMVFADPKTKNEHFQIGLRNFANLFDYDFGKVIENRRDYFVYGNLKLIVLLKSDFEKTKKENEEQKDDFFVGKKIKKVLPEYILDSGDLEAATYDVDLSDEDHETYVGLHKMVLRIFNGIHEDAIAQHFVATISFQDATKENVLYSFLLKDKNKDQIEKIAEEISQAILDVGKESGLNIE
eukprot:Platyproteum_vivax@DN9499_c0_g1_i1.p1